MKKRIYGFNVHLTLWLLFILTSCNKIDFDNLKTDNLITEWGLPLVNSKLTLSNFINDTTGTIHENEDGLITLVYNSKKLVSIEAKERTQIPDQYDYEYQEFNVEKKSPHNGTTIIFPLQFTISFDLAYPDQRIDSLFASKGMYKMKLRTNLNKNSASVKLIVRNFVRQNDTLARVLDLSNPQGNIDTLTVETTVDISDYYVYFENENFQIENKIYIDALVQFELDANPVYSTYFVDLTNEITDIEYTRFYGYIGKHTESYSDTISIDVFNSADFGTIDFGPDCIRLQVDFMNEVSIPVRIEAEKFTAYHSSNNTTDSVDIKLFGDNQANIFNINSPLCGSLTGEPTLIIFNNSNIVEALNISPNKVYFKLNGTMNYEDDVSAQNCFRDTSDINLQVKLELDLFGNISEFRIADTIDFSLDNIDQIQALDFRMEFSNGFPIAAFTELIFLNPENEILHSLFQNKEEIIAAGITSDDPDHRVIQPSTKTTIIKIDGDALDAIINASKMVFKASLSTEPDKLVKIYSDYSIDMIMAAKFYFNF